MASANITALTNYGGGQSPVDLMYVGKSPFGATDDRKTTLNDLFSTITKNITDGALRWQGFAAPALSAAGQGALYFDSTSNTWKGSRNAGAYENLIFGSGGNKYVTVWNSGADQVTGYAEFQYQATGSGVGNKVVRLTVSGSGQDAQFYTDNTFASTPSAGGLTNFGALNLYRNTTGSFPLITMKGGRSGPAFPSSLDVIGKIQVQSFNGTTTNEASYIQTLASQGHTSSLSGSGIEIWTTKPGASTATRRMIIGGGSVGNTFAIDPDPANDVTTTFGTNTRVAVRTPVTVDNNAEVIIAGASSTTLKQLVLQAGSSQTSNIFECQNSAGSILFAISAAGAITPSTYSASLIPASAGLDVGSAAAAWRNLYIYGSGTFGTTSIKFDGTPTAARTVTFPDNSGTVAELNLAQTFTANQVFQTTVTTGTGATAGLQVTANSLTTGNGVDISSTSATSGNLVSIASTSTAAASSTLTGLKIAMSGANAATGQTVTGASFSVTNTNGTSGTNVALTLTASGANTANTALNITAGTLATAGTIVQTSSSATAFVSGPNGATNPVFLLVNNTASSATGLSITGNAAGSGVTLTALSSAAGENILLLAKSGSNTVLWGNTVNSTRGSLVADANQAYVSTGSTTSLSFSTNNDFGIFTIFDTSKNLIGRAGSAIGWTSSTSNSNNSPDTLIRRAAAANLALGDTASATPIAQKLSTQGSRGGTDTNVAGANLSIVSGLGTGNATPSSLLLRGPAIGASGNTQQTEVTGLAILNGAAVLSNYTVATLPSASVCGAGALAFVTDATLTAITGLGVAPTGGGSNKVPVYSDGTQWLII